jgi:hypothetical protein
LKRHIVFFIFLISLIQPCLCAVPELPVNLFQNPFFLRDLRALSGENISKCHSDPERCPSLCSRINSGEESCLIPVILRERRARRIQKTEVWIHCVQNDKKLTQAFENVGNTSLYLAGGVDENLIKTTNGQKGIFSSSKTVEPKYNMLGGGMQRTASGNVKVTILKVENL